MRVPCLRRRPSGRYHQDAGSNLPLWQLLAVDLPTMDYGMTLSPNRHMNGNLNCFYCGQPFPRDGVDIKALLTLRGYFCQDACERDHLEAEAVQTHEAS